MLVPALAAYGIADKLAVSTEPPASVVSGDSFGLTVSVEDQFGNIDTSYNGTATLTLPSNPGGIPFNPITATFVNGQAVFDGLSESPVRLGLSIPGHYGRLHGPFLDLRHRLESDTQRGVVLPGDERREPSRRDLGRRE